MNSPAPSNPGSAGDARQTPGAQTHAFHDFGGRMVTIAVGPYYEEFQIHAGKLGKTGFFKAHGPPQPRPNPMFTSGQSAVGNVPAWGSGGEVKDEQEVTDTGDSMDIDQNVASPMIDYHLESKDTQAPRAFEIFANALYNTEPAEIIDRESLKISLKAYRFARNYKDYGLQNRIVERFREHYLSHNIKWDEITWVLKMFGDDANATPLSRYLFEQVAHDIATRGFNTFSNDNEYLKKHYLKEGDRKARAAFFEILARHAHSPRHPDPAEGRSSWRVVEQGPTAGEWVPEPFDNI